MIDSAAVTDKPQSFLGLTQQRHFSLMSSSMWEGQPSSILQLQPLEHEPQVHCRREKRCNGHVALISPGLEMTHVTFPHTLHGPNLMAVCVPGKQKVMVDKILRLAYRDKEFEVSPGDPKVHSRVFSMRITWSNLCFRKLTRAVRSSP